MATSTPTRAALLALHVQPPITELPADPGLVERIAAALVSARAAGALVIYVNIGFRIGYPELAEGDPMRAMLEPHGLLIDGVSNAVHPAVVPLDGDLQVMTPRCSAFSGTDLEMLLRRHRIERLVLTGISTGGVVFGTLSEADDRRYEVTVLADCVADPDPEVHRVLLGLFATPPRRARVISSTAWAAELRGE
jgi:nicotinamidase-related amidase